MDLYIGCVAQDALPDAEPGRVGIGHVGILNGITVEGSVGYYRTTFARGCLLSLVVPLLECQQPRHVHVHCNLPALMAVLQEDKQKQATVSFNPVPVSQGLRVNDAALMNEYRLLSGYHDLRFDWVNPVSAHWPLARACQLAEQALLSPTEIS